MDMDTGEAFSVVLLVPVTYRKNVFIIYTAAVCDMLKMIISFSQHILSQKIHSRLFLHYYFQMKH